MRRNLLKLSLSNAYEDVVRVRAYRSGCTRHFVRAIQSARANLVHELVSLSLSNQIFSFDFLISFFRLHFFFRVLREL